MNRARDMITSAVNLAIAGGAPIVTEQATGAMTASSGPQCRPGHRAQAIKARRLARKAQDFDTSTLALFGDGHRQQDLF
jgi:hypothetical protein